MKPSNKLFYCTFFDNRIQQSVLNSDGSRLSLLICSKDFDFLLKLGITVIVSSSFHSGANKHFDDKLISYHSALVIARKNAKFLFSKLTKNIY